MVCSFIFIYSWFFILVCITIYTLLFLNQKLLDVQYRSSVIISPSQLLIGLFGSILIFIYIELMGAAFVTSPTSFWLCSELSVFSLWLVFPFVYIYIVVTILTLVYLIAYNFSEMNNFLKLLLVVFLSGLGLFISNSFLTFFLFYELLLLPSFYILYNYAKTRKSVEAAFLMFFWTQLGAMCLFFFFISLFTTTNSILFSSLSYISLSTTHQTLGTLLLLIGFGVKFPIWPFYEWLPKAHVESSTNFSIFLSGVLVKFAFFGFFKCLFYFNSNVSVLLPYLWLVVGICDVSMKLYYQIDLKKLIAYATTVEMHWLCLALLQGQTVFWFSVYSMLISHAFLSSNFFFAVDSITRRFKTRLITEVSGIFILLPKLYISTLLLVITFLGFPASLFFISEFLFFSYISDFSMPLAFVLILILYFFVISCYFKNWFSMLFSYSNYFMSNQLAVDLDSRESALFIFLTSVVFLLGLFNSFLF